MQCGWYGILSAIIFGFHFQGQVNRTQIEDRFEIVMPRRDRFQLEWKQGKLLLLKGRAFDRIFTHDMAWIMIDNLTNQHSAVPSVFGGKDHVSVPKKVDNTGRATLFEPSVFARFFSLRFCINVQRINDTMIFGSNASLDGLDDEKFVIHRFRTPRKYFETPAMKEPETNQVLRIFHHQDLPR